jgi:hypothetical protein
MAAACAVGLAGLSVYYYYPLNPATPGEVVVSIIQDEKHPETEGRTDSSSITFSPYTSETNNTADSTVQQSTEKSELVTIDRKKRSPAKSKELTIVEMVDQNYTPIIASQLKRLEKTPIYAESPDYFNDLKSQWHNLEKDEKKVKEDIEVVGLSDHVMAQLIRIYQQKLVLLKQLQHEISKMNNQVKKYSSFKEKQPSYLKM